VSEKPGLRKYFLPLITILSLLQPGFNLAALAQTQPTNQNKPVEPRRKFVTQDQVLMIEQSLRNLEPNINPELRKIIGNLKAYKIGLEFPQDGTMRLYNSVLVTKDVFCDIKISTKNNGVTEVFISFVYVLPDLDSDGKQIFSEFSGEPLSKIYELLMLSVPLNKSNKRAINIYPSYISTTDDITNPNYINYNSPRSVGLRALLGDSWQELIKLHQQEAVYKFNRPDVFPYYFGWFQSSEFFETLIEIALKAREKSDPTKK